METVCVRMDENILVAISRQAEKRGIDRSKHLRQIIQDNFSQYNHLTKLEKEFFESMKKNHDKKMIREMSRQLLKDITAESWIKRKAFHMEQNNVPNHAIRKWKKLTERLIHE